MAGFFGSNIPSKDEFSFNEAVENVRSLLTEGVETIDPTIDSHLVFFTSLHSKRYQFIRFDHFDQAIVFITLMRGRKENYIYTGSGIGRYVSKKNSKTPIETDPNSNQAIILEAYNNEGDYHRLWIGLIEDNPSKITGKCVRKWEELNKNFPYFMEPVSPELN